MRYTTGTNSRFNYMSPRVLITGVCGFIGSNMAAGCLERGWSVDGVDDMSGGSLRFLPPSMNVDDGGLTIADFVDPHVLARIRGGAYDYVFHLAAQPRVSYSVEQPIETNDVNVTKTLQLMEACRGNIKRFIFASSSAVYGQSDVLPTPEDSPKSPESPYGLQKLIIEDYLRLYWRLYRMDSACMRFFNVFGKNQLGGSPYSTAISSWLTSIKRGQPMRSDGDGTQTRDLCHVDNVVDACVRAALAKGPLMGDAFNVACGERHSNLDVLEYLKDRYPFAPIHDAPPRAGDVMHTQASISKAEIVLGYVPTVDVWRGLDRTIEWYNNEWDRVSSIVGT